MKSWSFFIITIGTLFILIYPKTYQLINLLMGISIVIIGVIFLLKGRKK